ncbi:hypothetical protein [Bartonella gabonensis]|uniref:hypothetical protein n=1 Tax=Bartonella gabonensis TaxID=2699889 RepID=UPI0015892E9E|nr:hypothetical protein [Bartonella gabonensis]
MIILKKIIHAFHSPCDALACSAKNRQDAVERSRLAILCLTESLKREVRLIWGE